LIFDCDGVLVDSEPIAARLTAEAVSELGWQMTPELAKAEFLGDTFKIGQRKARQTCWPPSSASSRRWPGW
jgi:beta-phosphoglucomutase-like phosphatase (HAD superfamily)